MTIEMINALQQNYPWTAAIIVITVFLSIAMLIRGICIWIVNKGWPRLKWKVNGPPDMIEFYALQNISNAGIEIEKLPDNYEHYYIINGQLYKLDCLPGIITDNKLVRWVRHIVLRKVDTMEDIPTWQIRTFETYKDNIYMIYYAPCAILGNAYDSRYHAQAIGEDDRSFERRMERRNGIHIETIYSYMWEDKKRVERLLVFLDTRHTMNQLVNSL